MSITGSTVGAPDGSQRPPEAAAPEPQSHTVRQARPVLKTPP